MNKPIIALAAAVAVAGLGVWYYFGRQRAPAPAPVAAPASALAPASPPIRHPVPAASSAAGGTAASLPALDDSDAALRSALGGLIGADAVKSWLAGSDLIRRTVVTVDNLARAKVPADRRPVPGPSGAFLAQGDPQHATIDPRNYARYTPMVDVIQNLDMHALANVYFRFYPLFESAYRDLGYPDGYFNDRLIDVIDLLLATPQPQGPIALVQPNVQYQFADPKLEALPAGQKILIRMGPDNATAVKAKLSELRAALTAASPAR